MPKFQVRISFSKQKCDMRLEITVYMYFKVKIFYVKLIISFQYGKTVFTKTDLISFNQISTKSQIQK